MYTHLTTYFSPFSIYAQSVSAFSSSVSNKYTRAEENNTITSNNTFETLYAIAVSSFSTDFNGYITYSVAEELINLLNDPIDSAFGTIGVDAFSFEMTTSSAAPYSYYTGLYAVGGYEFTDSFSFGASVEGAFTVAHFGGYISRIGAGFSTSWDGTDTTGGAYNAVPSFFDTLQGTTYTAPSFTTESTTIVIVVTQQANTNYTFLETVYNISTIIGQTANTAIEFQTTKSVTTDINHHIGTGINSNNSDYTLITDTNADGEQISPYACFLSSPNTDFFSGTDISTFSNTVITNNNQEFTDNMPTSATENIFSSTSSFPTTTLTNEYTTISYSSDASERILDYLYDGNNGDFASESTNYTSRATQQSTFEMYSYPSSMVGTNYITTRTVITTATVQTQMNGVLQEQGEFVDSSMLFTTISKTTLTYATIEKTFLAPLSTFRSTNYYTVNNGQSEGITTIEGESCIFRFESWKGSAELAFTKTIIDSLFPASQTVYSPTIINDENWAGYGNIYSNVAVSGGQMSFSEQPKIYYFKNRITYNASNLSKNNGIFSILNSKAYKDYEFPAFGIGDTFTTIISEISNTEETTETTFTRKILAGVANISDPFVATFILPESSSITDTSFTAYTTWAVAYTNASITRVMPNGASTTIYRGITFSDADSVGYNDVNSAYSAFQIIKGIFVSPNKSVRSLPDWVTIGNSGVFTGESDDLFISLLPCAYYVTEIITEIDSFSTSSYTTTYADATFSASNFMVLRPMNVFRRKGEIPEDSIGIQFLGGYAQDWIGASGYDSRTIRFWDTGASYSNTIFNFTSYIGSTYIDV